MVHKGGNIIKSYTEHNQEYKRETDRKSEYNNEYSEVVESSSHKETNFSVLLHKKKYILKNKCKICYEEFILEENEIDNKVNRSHRAEMNM